MSPQPRVFRPHLLSLPGPSRYALALLLGVAATAVRAVPHRLIQEGSPFLPFAAAVFLAALYLGTGPAMLCLAISAGALLVLFAPEATWLRLEDAEELGLFLAVAAGLILLLGAQRRGKARLHEANLRLGRQADQLSAEVAQRRRVEAALRRSNAELEDFAHVISHDLKEPLRGITLRAQFVLEDYGRLLDQRGRQQLELLIRLPRQMSEQLTALLECSRIGRSEARLEATDVGEVAAEVIEHLGPWLREHSAQVLVRPDLPWVLCDRAHLAQVLTNLVSNGVKYNDSAVKLVEIGSARSDRMPADQERAGSDGADHWPAIFVRDNGIGIDPGRRSEVFRMFRRLHAAGQYGGGTGAGLALVQRAVERTGGRIWFESAPGEGSTFWFTIGPAAAASDRYAVGGPSVDQAGAEAGPAVSHTPEVHTRLRGGLSRPVQAPAPQQADGDAHR